jgi:hypothetical protein
VNRILMKHQIALVLFISLILAAVFSTACQKSNQPASTFDAAAHRSEIQKWQRDRLISLTKEDGWLTLVGLFWLNEGENKFGSDPKNVIVLPKDKAPAHAGSFWLEKGRVRLDRTPGGRDLGIQESGVTVKRDGKGRSRPSISKPIPTTTARLSCFSVRSSSMS